MKSNLIDQINELANFIMAEIEGEPEIEDESESEGAVECAIRIMREQRDRIATLEILTMKAKGGDKKFNQAILSGR